MSVDDEIGNDPEGEEIGLGASPELEEATRILREGVAKMRAHEYKLAFRLFESVYKSDNLPKPVTGLSYYGLCLAKVKRSYREAIMLCEKALAERPEDVVHHLNLGETYLEAGRRRRALDTVNRAILKFPKTKALQALREKIGMRRNPVLPFLPRSNPINVILGHMRHTYLEDRKQKARKS